MDFLRTLPLFCSLLILLAACNFEANNEIIHRDASEFKVGDKIFSDKDIDRICVYQDGADFSEVNSEIKTVPYGKIAVVEYRKQGTSVWFAENDRINHNIPILGGKPFCTETPQNIVLYDIHDMLLMSLEK